MIMMMMMLVMMIVQIIYKYKGREGIRERVERVYRDEKTHIILRNIEKLAIEFGRKKKKKNEKLRTERVIMKIHVCLWMDGETI